jgi:hypothetical protein
VATATGAFVLLKADETSFLDGIAATAARELPPLYSGGIPTLICPPPSPL